MSSEETQEMARQPSIEKTGFRSIETVGRVVLMVIQRFWRLCSAAGLTLLLLYWLYGGVASFLLLTAAVLGAFYHCQDFLLYFPDQPESSRMFVPSPRRLGIPHENVYLKCSDGVLINVVLIKQSGNTLRTAPTLLYFHGNAGNIGHRLASAWNFYSACTMNVLLVEYRGYGRSEGNPSERGFQRDADAAINYLFSRSDIDTSKIIIFGRSLGGAVAIDLASRPGLGEQAFALIVENTFTSIPEMANKLLFSGIHRLPNFCFKNKYDSLSKIKHIQVPTLFLSGLADTLIPARMMLTLFTTSTASLKRFVPFENGTHNETWQCYGYQQSVFQFIQEVEAARESGMISVNNVKSKDGLSKSTELHL